MTIGSPMIQHVGKVLDDDECARMTMPQLSYMFLLTLLFYSYSVYVLLFATLFFFFVLSFYLSMN